MNKKLKLVVLILGFISIYGTAYFLATDLFEHVLLFGKIPLLAPLFLFSFILTSLLITFLSNRKSTQNFKNAISKVLKVLLLIIFLATLSWAISNYLLQPYQLNGTIYEHIFSLLHIFILIYALSRIYKA